MPEPFNASAYLLRPATRPSTAGRLAITGPEGDLTYRALAEYADDLAAGLQSWGLRPEERIVLLMADGPAPAAMILAAMRLGAIPVPLSTMITERELEAVLLDARPRILVVSERFAATAAGAVARIPGIRYVAVDGEASFPVPPGVRLRPLDDLLHEGERRGGEIVEACQTWEDSPALWLYTSGTTGTPKAAMHRHVNIRHVVETYARQVLGIGPQDRCYSVPKLFFAYGIGNSLFFPLSVGATAILDPARPTPESVADRLLTFRPTLFFAVPTFYAALLAADVPREVFGSVRLAVSAGEPLPADLYRRFTQKYGVEVIDGIGSTEALHIFMSNRPGQVRPGTTGMPVPGYEVRLVDSEGRDVEPGTPGSLLVKGESIAIGYWCRTMISRRAFLGEWLRTGDTYVADADGYYTSLGRTDDMLKAGGIWVSPTEVEARLLEHPSVTLAAVVGFPDRDGIDKPIACVVLAEGADATPAELISFCRSGLAAYKRPREILIVDRLPTTATGKLQRFAVREMAASLMGAAIEQDREAGAPG